MMALKCPSCGSKKCVRAMTNVSVLDSRVTRQEPATWCAECGALVVLPRSLR